MDLIPSRSRFSSRLARPFEKDMVRIQREMNDLVDNFLDTGFVNAPRIYNADLYPSVDIKETDDKYLLEAEFPGMTEKDIELDLHNNILTICGEKKSNFEEEKEGYICTERYYGSFSRDIPFSDEVDPTKVKASLKNGILNVELSKKENTQKTHKKIEIRH